MLPLSTFEESSPLHGAPAGMMSTSSSEPTSTIDEPIRDTIMRDVNSIKKKFAFILYPSEGSVAGLSRDWDLWGPFILCLLLSVILATQAGENQKGYVFALVYIFVFAGSALVTLNALLLKGNVSFFQTVCVLGYCILPMAISAVGCWLVNRALSGLVKTLVKLAIVGWGLLWGAKASVGFMSGLVPDDRRALGVYPVWLLYVAISWIVFLT